VLHTKERVNERRFGRLSLAEEEPSHQAVPGMGTPKDLWGNANLPNFSADNRCERAVFGRLLDFARGRAGELGYPSGPEGPPEPSLCFGAA
jgi:hypothetical protein